MLSIDGHSKPYAKFKKEILKRTDAIYTSLEAFLSNELPFPYGRKVTNDILKELATITQSL